MSVRGFFQLKVADALVAKPIGRPDREATARGLTAIEALTNYESTITDYRNWGKVRRTACLRSAIRNSQFVISDASRG